jgi:phage-related protein
MELVLTYNDKSKGSTELYLLDELHDIFAPHIDEAYRHPSPTLQDDDDDDEQEEMAGQFSYACSMPMLDDIRALRYDAQAEVCKAFHKMIQKGFPTDDSFLIKRFEETYKEIYFRHLDDSLDEIHYAINDLDNAIYEIDMIDPMTFFDVERKLAPIIKRSPKKGEDIQ